MSDAGSAHLPPVTLVLGGARSGKSAYAEALIAGAGTYLATGEPGDAEMVERIRQHRLRRGPEWITIEEPVALVAALAAAAAERPVLVDCLTLWLSNLMARERDLEAETTALTTSLPTLAEPVVLVANEVGLGIVPTTALGRRFRDAAGRLNQQVARAANKVVWIVAGLPLTLKDDRS